jgi:hypothetical protein
MGATTRPITIKKSVEFPVYGLDFTAEDLLIAGGGGGPNGSGVKNSLVGALVSQIKTIDNS